jgi:polygalacturonase
LAATVGICTGSNAVGLPEFPVTAHKAVGDGLTLNTQAIQATIDDCAAHGGGTVIIPKGTFVSGSIFLKQGVNLKVDAGGILKGSQDTNDYPWIDTRIAGFEMRWPAALVNARSMTNVDISGPGTIDGSGARWWREYWDTRSHEKEDIDPHFKVARPRLVCIENSKKVVVKDVLLINPAFWNLQITYCEGVLVSNLTVRARGESIRAASSDGIDIDSTRDVLITHCDIECDDDGICLKSGRDADGLRVNRPTEDVVIRDCRVGHAAGLVVFGSETAGGIRNVKILNCKADKGCEEVVRFKTRMGRGGVVENILYQDIEADSVRTVFSFNMEAFSNTWVPEKFRTEVPPQLGTPIFRNIEIRNLHAINCTHAGRMIGLPESPLENITLENVDLKSSDGFLIRNAHKMRFINVKLNGKAVYPPEEMATTVKSTGKNSTADILPKAVTVGVIAQ